MAMTASILDYLSVLADPTRVRLLGLLEDHELTVGDLCEVLEVPQSTASRHLKVLLDHGWLARRREGTRHFYNVARRWPDETGRRVWELVRAGTADLPSVQRDRDRLSLVLAARRAASEAYFERTGEAWLRIRAEVFGDRFDLAALLGLLDPDWTVGDLGCGAGSVSAMLAPFVARVIAVDGSPVMLDAARRTVSGLENVEVRGGDLEDLPMGDAALDAATLVLVLHHAALPGRVLAETARVMKPGARLMIVDMEPHDDEDMAARMGHVWLGFEASQMEKFLHVAGFDRVVVRSLPIDRTANGPRLFVASGRRSIADERARIRVQPGVSRDVGQLAQGV